MYIPTTLLLLKYKKKRRNIIIPRETIWMYYVYDYHHFRFARNATFAAIRII